MPRIDATMATTAALQQEIAAHLASKSLTAAPAWVADYVASSRSNTPLNALKQTALFRILASDFRQTLQPTISSVLPESVADPNVKERKLSGPLPVQLLDIDDIGRSRWSQIEEMESAERGETTKGREIVRVLPNEDGSVPLEHPRSTGPHKVMLQDARGTCIYGIALSEIRGIDLSMNIGTKLVLKNVSIARGVALLEPAVVQVLGGKIDPLHQAWREGRKDALKALAGTPTQN